MTVHFADSAQFIVRFGHLFEHSPWVVERAWSLRPAEDVDSLHAAFLNVLQAASHEECLGLLRAHPQLADKAAIRGGLTADSAAEQTSAGLDQLTSHEYECFHDLNARYQARFGFPFIICVRLHDKSGILAAMRARLDRTPEEEFEEALLQVGLISRLRLEDSLRQSGLEALEARVHADLDYIDFNGPSWLKPKAAPDGARVLDVAIIGAGQSGLAAAFGLMRERVRNIMVFDESRAGNEGPWVTYARMLTLRTPKHLSSVDLGMPSLTFRAWWEAQAGKAGWARIDKIPRRDWMSYLRWFRRVLNIPVQNETRVTRVEPMNGLHRLTLTRSENTSFAWARNVVFATGIQGGGEWHTPALVRALPKARYAHTAEPINYAALAGKRIAILGGGASAFDNAQFALNEGVAEAHVFMRKSDLPRVNPIRHMEISGLIRHFATLDDARKYRAMRFFHENAQPPTNDTFGRAAAMPGFHLHLGAPWRSVDDSPTGVIVSTPQGALTFDFLVLSTGLVNDLALRPELAAVRDDIALWSDRYKAPADERHDRIDEHPYLGAGFEFQGRTPEGAARVAGLYAFNYSALASLGLSAAAISGLAVAAPKLAAAIAARLFTEESDTLLSAYLAYDEPEFLGQWPPA